MKSAMTLHVEQEKAHRTSPTALSRQSGLLAIAAGASMILVPLVHPSSPQSASWVPVHLVYFATLTAMQLVLVGLFARLRRTGTLGVVAFLMAFVGTSMMLLEGREHIFSSDFGQGTPVGLWQLVIASFVFSIGYVLLGVAMVRTNVLPGGAGILLALGGPVVAFAPPIGIQTVIIIGHTLFGLGLAWSGYALWSSAARERSPGG